MDECLTIKEVNLMGTQKNRQMIITGSDSYLVVNPFMTRYVSLKTLSI